MKKFLLFSILLISLPLNCVNGFIGPFLSKLKMKDLYHNNDNRNVVINKFPRQRIYQIRVLKQPDHTLTCARHSIKNLIYIFNALDKPKRKQLKLAIKRIYNRKAFRFLNKRICLYVGISNFMKKGTTLDQIEKVLHGIYTNDFQNQFKRSVNFFPVNVNNIIGNSLWQVFRPLNPIAFNLINNYQYVDDNNLLTIIYHSYPFRRVLQRISDFKQSESKTLAIFLSMPNDSELQSYHSINLLVRKVKNTFEFFVTDAANLNEPYWLKTVQFFKHLFNLPIGRLDNLILQARA